MKTIINILIIAFLFIGCTKEETQSQEISIYGTWKLVEMYYSSGAADGKWNKVSDGYIYKFNVDGSFTSNRFSECSSGSYEVTSKQITLKYGCPNFDIGITNPPNIFIENFGFENGFLFLSPSYMNCVEGCSFKFEKIE